MENSFKLYQSLIRLELRVQRLEKRVDQVKVREEKRAASHKKLLYRATVALRRKKNLPKDLPAMLTVQQLSEYLNLSSRTVWRMVSRGEIKNPVKVGGARRFRRKDVDDYLNSLET
ncbi:MAG: helix-turn-helix domain-containing protein [Patescibacteria group bacterium]|nr:helix-turn-helix domain-containing protein [Patescibacteria group bacterium]